jgi:beta-N-acetylhexosaminidase
MPSPLELAKKSLGQLFITGLSGLELSPASQSFLKDSNIGGVILFAPNYDSPGQVAELINTIQECRSGYPLWISVDHEGGRVQRFKTGFTRIPDAGTVAATNSPKLVFEIAQVMARELKAVGVNLNYAPVADINTNPKNPVIGNRAFGSKEEDVTKMITAIVRGHLTEGVQPCVKHFPGHGDTSTDSHFALPKVDTDLDTLLEREFKPFSKAFKSHCTFVMTAHVICSKIDPERPATLSRKILTDILRNQLRYTGLIVSDDMEMKAVTDHFGAEDAPRLAIEAGCDLLIYRTEAAARVAYSACLKALDTGRLAHETVLAAAARILALKKELFPHYKPVNVAGISDKLATAENLAVLARIGAGG